jgi:ubiquinone biosynthesis protein
MTEFVAWTREELDYRSEARYSERLRVLSAGSPIQYVPKVYGELTTRRVLVVEFLEGVTMLDYLRARERGDEVMLQRLKAAGFDGRRFAANIIDNFLGDAFRHGIYHADLHPANLMILPGNVVGYIDFGITGVLSPYSRRHLVIMTLALAQGDMETLQSQFLKLSVFDASSDLAGFRAGLHELARGWYGHDGRHKRLQVNFTRVMTDMLHLSRRTRVMPERDIVKYIRSAIAIDGVNLRFEPGFHVGRYLEEECGRFVQWQAVRSALSNDTLLAWSGTGTRMITEAPAQAGNLMDRMLRGDLAVRANRTGCADPGSETRSRALLLASMVFILVTLMVLTRQPVAFGWNLFTTEVGLVLWGLALLVPTLKRLTAPGAEERW